MVKRILTAGLTGILALPLSVLAAQDVVFSENIKVTLSDPSMTLFIQNTRVDDVTINTNNVVMTMSANFGPVTITSPDRYKFTVSGITDPGTNCTVDESRLVLPTQSSAVTVTITPSTVCAVMSGGSAPSLNLSSSPLPLPAPVTTIGIVTATPGQGGETTYINPDGLKAVLKIPADSLTANTIFTISEVKKTDPAVSAVLGAIPQGKQLIGTSMYDYSAVFAGTGGQVTSFLKDVTIGLPYTDAQIAGFDVSALKIHYYSEAEKRWMALPTTVNVASKQLFATINHFTRFAILGALKAEVEVPAVQLVDISGRTIVDGDLIKTSTSFDIYIVKLVGAKRFKRLILNPAIFNSYGHLNWNNVKTVSQAVQDAYTLSELVIEVNEDGSVANPKVYKVSSAPNSDVGQKQWLNMTAAQFEAAGYDWDAIYKVNHTEASPNFYPEGAPITP